MPSWENLGSIAIWLVVVINLVLTLRLVQWHRSLQEQQAAAIRQESVPELEPGVSAPDFQTSDLDGRSFGLSDYSGRDVAFVFVSPHCGPCRRELPQIDRLARVARERRVGDIVLVSDVGTAETQNWLAEISSEKHTNFELTCLVPAHRGSHLIDEYNPRGITPYFCHLDEAGRVVDRGVVNNEAWRALARSWSGRPVERSATLRRPNRSDR